MTNGHPTREEDFDLYVLGALEGDEKQAIESHLAGCTDCSRKLAAARGRVAAISFAAPRVEAVARGEGSPAPTGPRRIASAFSCAFKGTVGQRESSGPAEPVVNSLRPSRPVVSQAAGSSQFSRPPASRS